MKSISFKIRVKAICFAIYHGFLPTWCYEKTPHHNTTYLKHLFINLKYAFRWLTFNEHPTDIEFERETNQNF